MCNSIPPPITPHLLCLRLLLPCRLLLHVLPPPLFLLLLLRWLRRLLHLFILLLLLLLLGLLRLRLLYAVTSLPLRREVCALGPLLQRLWDGSCDWPLGIPAAIVPRLSPLWGRRGSRMLLLCPVPLGLARLPVLLVILACQVDQRLGRRPLPPPVLRRRPRRGGSQVQAQRRALLPPAGPGLRGGETASRFFVLPRNALGAAQAHWRPSIHLLQSIWLRGRQVDHLRRHSDAGGGASAAKEPCRAPVPCCSLQHVQKVARAR